jgi:hypothetical protein
LRYCLGPESFAVFPREVGPVSFEEGFPLSSGPHTALIAASACSGVNLITASGLVEVTAYPTAWVEVSDTDGGILPPDTVMVKPRAAKSRLSLGAARAGVVPVGLSSCPVCLRAYGVP